MLTPGAQFSLVVRLVKTINPQSRAFFSREYDGELRFQFKDRGEFVSITILVGICWSTADKKALPLNPTLIDISRECNHEHVEWDMRQEATKIFEISPFVITQMAANRHQLA